MISRFSRPVSSSWIAADCPDRPIVRRTVAASLTTSWPSTSARPPSGGSSVVKIRTAVVLPAPLGPSTPSTVPCGTDRSMPRSACTSPNDLVKPSTMIAGCSPTSLYCDIHPPENQRPRTLKLPGRRRPQPAKYSATRVVVRRNNNRELIVTRQGEELKMPDESPHESADLQDYSVQEPADSLTGIPGEAGDDPLDRGVAPPDRWSAGIKFGSTADEQSSGESLDQLLAEEEPDTPFDVDDDLPEDRDDDDEADEYIDGLLLDDGRIPGRAGW